MATKINNRLVLPPALASFAKLLKAESYESQPPKFSVQLLWSQNDTPALEPLIQVINEVAVEEFGDKAVQMFKDHLLKHPLHRGSIEKPDKELYKDKIYTNVSAPEDRRPAIIDQRGCAITTDADIYSGCTIRCSVSVYAYNKSGGKGVAIGLNGVQVVAKGPRLDGGSDPMTDFAAFIDPNAPGGVTSSSAADSVAHSFGKSGADSSTPF